MNKLSALLIALTMSAAASAQVLGQSGTIQVGDQTITGTVQSVGNGTVTITTPAGQTLNLVQGATPGSYTVGAGTTVPGVAAGATTTVTTASSAVAGATGASAAAAGFGAVGVGGAVAAAAAFVAVVATSSTNNATGTSATGT